MGLPALNRLPRIGNAFKIHIKKCQIQVASSLLSQRVCLVRLGVFPVMVSGYLGFTATFVVTGVSSQFSLKTLFLLF